jgi:hypothetical protein
LRSPSPPHKPASHITTSSGTLASVWLAFLFLAPLQNTNTPRDRRSQVSPQPSDIPQAWQLISHPVGEVPKYHGGSRAYLDSTSHILISTAPANRHFHRTEAIVITTAPTQSPRRTAPAKKGKTKYVLRFGRSAVKNNCDHTKTLDRRLRRFNVDCAGVR